MIFEPRKLKFFNIPMVVQIGLETTLVSALLPILTRGHSEVALRLSTRLMVNKRRKLLLEQNGILCCRSKSLTND